MCRARRVCRLRSTEEWSTDATCASGRARRGSRTVPGSNRLAARARAPGNTSVPSPSRSTARGRPRSTPRRALTTSARASCTERLVRVGNFFPKRVQDDMDRIMILSLSDDGCSPANQFHAETAVCNFDVEGGERNFSVGAKITAFRGVTHSRHTSKFEVGRRRADLSQKRTRHEARYGMRDPPPPPFAIRVQTPQRNGRSVMSTKRRRNTQKER